MTTADSARRAAVQRAGSLLDLGRSVDAEALLRSALTEHPEDPDLQLLLVRALLDQERYDEARHLAGWLVGRNPTDVDALRLLAVAQSNLGDHHEAHRSATTAVHLAPHDPGVHLLAAQVALAAGRRDEALHAADRARAMAPHWPEAHVTRGRVLLDAGRVAEASLAAHEALRLQPDLGSAHALLGSLGLRQGRAKESVAGFRAALREDPQDFHARAGLEAALRARNPVFAATLRFSLWLEELDPGVRIAVMIAPIVVNRLLAAFDGQLWAEVLRVVVIAAVFLTWAAAPIGTLTLLASRADRPIVSPSARHAALGFLGLAVAAVVSFTLAATTDLGFLGLLGFGMVLWSLALGALEGVTGRTLTVVRSCAAGALAITVAGWVTALAGATSFPSLPGMLVLLGAIPALWYLAFRKPG